MTLDTSDWFGKKGYLCIYRFLKDSSSVFSRILVVVCLL